MSSVELDVALERLQGRRDVWVATSPERRATLLRQCLTCTLAAADAWVQTICEVRGIDPEAPLAGEERLGGPYCLMRLLRLSAETLEGSSPRMPAHLTESGRAVAQVFPRTAIERLLWLGCRGEVWLEPGTSAHRRLGRGPGRVALVLGAGNITSIGPTDALHLLLAENTVVLLKLNPLTSRLKPILEQALAPLVQEGFLTIVQGGAEEGRYLAHHPLVDAVHITGSHHTYNALVWQDGKRVLDKPVTAELGAVTPVLVVPGSWSDADLDYQARHVASMVYHNAGFDCAAAQVVLTDRRWPQRSGFLNRLRRELKALPPRRAYYPGASARHADLCALYPQAERLGRSQEGALAWTLVPDVPLEEGEPALTREAFCGLLFEAPVDAGGTLPFLDEAVRLANERLWGNLSSVLLVHPLTTKEHASAVESAIARLDYGDVGVNVWPGVIFALMELPWGAAPGNTPEDIRSGVGFVHNAYGFEHAAKAVLRAPFRTAHMPPWFAGHRNLDGVARALCDLEADPGWGEAVQVLVQVLKAGFPPGLLR